MPISFDPNATFQIVLATDADKPAGQRPAFIFRYMTNREWLRVEELFAAADEASTTSEYVTRTNDALRIGLVGWEHMVDRDGQEIPYANQDLDRVTTAIDSSELRARLFEESSASELDKKTRVAIAIQFGRVCRICRPGICADCPTELEPLLLKCVACDGKGCPECDTQGTWELKSCPTQFVDRQTCQLMRHARFAEQGILPVAGGTLDQTRSFVEALDFAQSERNYWQTQLLK